jgi:hypothetical protein
VKSEILVIMMQKNHFVDKISNLGNVG